MYHSVLSEALINIVYEDIIDSFVLSVALIVSMLTVGSCGNPEALGQNGQLCPLSSPDCFYAYCRM